MEMNTRWRLRFTKRAIVNLLCASFKDAHSVATAQLLSHEELRDLSRYQNNKLLITCENAPPAYPALFPAIKNRLKFQNGLYWPRI